MPEQPHSVVKTKAVIFSFIIWMLSFGYKVLDGVLNTESVLQKAFGEKLGLFLAGTQGRTVLVGVSFFGFTTVLLYKFHKYENALNNYYQAQLIPPPFQTNTETPAPSSQLTMPIEDTAAEIIAELERDKADIIAEFDAYKEKYFRDSQLLRNELDARVNN